MVDTVDSSNFGSCSYRDLGLRALTENRGERFLDS